MKKSWLFIVSYLYAYFNIVKEVFESPTLPTIQIWFTTLCNSVVLDIQEFLQIAKVTEYQYHVANSLITSDVQYLAIRYTPVQVEHLTKS